MRIAIAPTKRSRIKMFAGPAEEPRARRASDVIALVGAAVVITVVGVSAIPTSRFEAAVARMLGSLPSFLDSVWSALLVLPWVAGAVVVAGAAFRRRLALVRDLVVAGVVALGLAYVGGRLVEGTWAELTDILSSATWSFPAPPLAVAGAVMVTASPHLIRPLRHAMTRLLWAAALAAAVLQTATPGESVAGVMLAVATGAVVHLVFGSVRGRPGLPDVAAALVELGVDARLLGVAARQEAGEFLVNAEDSMGRPLLVKVYGRDAHDTQLLAAAWRAVLYREPGATPPLGRLHQVEHEALMTLLAGHAGVNTFEVVTAGAVQSTDALLVLRPIGRPVGEEAETWSPETLAEMWATLASLHGAGLSHGQIDGRHWFVIPGSGPGYPISA